MLANIISTDVWQLPRRARGLGWLRWRSSAQQSFTDKSGGLRLRRDAKLLAQIGLKRLKLTQRPGYKPLLQICANQTTLRGLVQWVELCQQLKIAHRVAAGFPLRCKVNEPLKRGAAGCQEINGSLTLPTIEFRRVG
jgi:hypothetical protein